MNFYEGDRVKVVAFWEDDDTFPAVKREEIKGRQGVVIGVVPNPIEAGLTHIVGGTGDLLYVTLDEPFHHLSIMTFTASELDYV